MNNNTPWHFLGRAICFIEKEQLKLSWITKKQKKTQSKIKLKNEWMNDTNTIG